MRNKLAAYLIVQGLATSFITESFLSKFSVTLENTLGTYSVHGYDVKKLLMR